MEQVGEVGRKTNGTIRVFAFIKVTGSLCDTIIKCDSSPFFTLHLRSKIFVDSKRDVPSFGESSSSVFFRVKIGR